MKKKYYLLATLSALVVTSFIFYPKDEVLITKNEASPSINKKVLVETEKKMEPQMMTDLGNRTPTALDNLTTITSSEIRSFHEAFPSEKQVKEDMKSNPHTPSKSLMKFAKQLGPIMEKAFKDENNAKILTSELKVCAQDESVAIAARALCVQDTEKLAQYHPHIKGKAVELRASMPPEVQKILDTNDAFIKK